MRSVVGFAVLVACMQPMRARGADGDALEARAKALEKRLDGEGLTVVIEPPFVIVGDEKPAKVKKRAESTVRWAVKLLKQDYFARDPDEVIEIWIFGDEKRYRKGAKKFFGDDPDTPYGYFSPTHDAIVMNVGPGAGTLVHEIVHPFMAANFGDAPAWINEGLASLYEYPVEVKGHLRGKVNWRLRGLKQELADGHRREFSSLCATSDEEFYDAEDDTYAQARYVMYWLQEHGKLIEFMKAFHDAQAGDANGCKTLAKVMGGEDVDAKYAAWVKWVQKLEE